MKRLSDADRRTVLARTEYDKARGACINHAEQCPKCDAPEKSGCETLRDLTAKADALRAEEERKRGALMGAASADAMMLICDVLDLDNGRTEWSPDTIEEVARIAGLWVQKCKALVIV